METTGPNIDLFGFEELNKFFETMERKDQRKVILDAFRTGGKPLIKLSRAVLSAQRKRKSVNNNLYKSIGFVAMPARRSSVFVTAKIGARRFKPFKGFHGHLFDAGTVARQTRQGWKRGTMPETNFFSNPLAQTLNSMTDTAANEMLAALNKLIQKNLKKQNAP